MAKYKELKAKVASLEKELQELKETKIQVSDYTLNGMNIFQKLGEFIQIAVEDGPRTTKLILDLEGSEPKALLYLWATIDEKEPVARIAEITTGKNAAIQRANRAELELRKLRGNND